VIYMNRFEISEKDILLMHKVLSAFSPIKQALIFGVHPRNMKDNYSDVDICLFGNLNDSEAEHVRSQLNALDLPYEFDVICYKDTKSYELRDRISLVGMEVYSKE